MTIEVVEAHEIKPPLAEAIRRAAVDLAPDVLDAAAAMTIALAALTVEAEVDPNEIVQSYAEALAEIVRNARIEG